MMKISFLLRWVSTLRWMKVLTMWCKLVGGTTGPNGSSSVMLSCQNGRALAMVNIENDKKKKVSME